MLHTVIGDHDVDISVFQQCGHRLRTVRPDTHRASGTGRQHHCLVTNRGRIAVPSHLLWPVACPTTIATRDDPGTQTTFAQVIREPDYQWRLSSTANGDIADHQHRDVKPLRTQ